MNKTFKNKTSKKALLIVNLGSPDSTKVSDVRKYLRRFLMDPLVIDLPFLLRWFLVNVVIAPFRARPSAEAYKKIWSERDGSPLIMHSQKFATKLAAELPDYEVRLAMRFGQPDLRKALTDLAHSGAQELKILAMYPQYAMSSTESVLQEVRDILKDIDFRGQVSTCLTFADDQGFISAVTDKIETQIVEFRPDHVLLSFHGLPVRHVKKISATCEGRGDCSLQLTSGNQLCYRRQSFLSSKLITKRLSERASWSADKISVGFQSRLNSEWIQPFSDEFYRQLPKMGVRRLLVACPSFTADCLETLEEVAMRGRAEFVASGGEDLRLVPCVNESEAWVRAAGDLVRNANRWSEL